MKLFDVYPLFPIEVVKGKGAKVYDSKGNEYLDLYGGHAVISVGHTHPTYVKAISEQVARLGFYSNSVINGLQISFAEKLGKASGYDDYSPVEHAEKLTGKFLLVHGMADDNVHEQHSIELQRALIDANKSFECFYYPNQNHGIYKRLHLYKMMTDFIEKNL